MKEDILVGFVGMTHLGLVSATALAAKGFSVVCCDQSDGLIRQLQNGRLPIVEPNLKETIIANGERQSFTCNFSDLNAADIVYLAPDVPTDENGDSDLSSIKVLIDAVLPVLGPRSLLVVLCQVPPGHTRTIPLETSRLYYQVETLVFGIAMDRALHPESYSIGCARPDQDLPPALGQVLNAGKCPVLKMSYESAELAKISINMCLVSSISVANTMAELCERLGADWHEIVPALRLDRRIGKYSYLSPGLGVAGGNLERDMATVLRLGSQKETDTKVVKAWIENSRYRKRWVVRAVKALGLGESQLAVWGLAYKANTNSIKNSPSIETIAGLPDADFRVHDPVVSHIFDEESTVEQYENPLSVLAGSAALLVMTPWPLYRTIEVAEISSHLSGNVVIDPYGALDSHLCQSAGLYWRSLGSPARTQIKDNV